ncbi:MAG: F0F1 ATP synthase subunit delta [Prevotella sp.]|nr:F0F1 ATP synthase subunit delta [Candidatus Prevotella equi]
MDLGVISVRYARALLKCSLDAKKEDLVYQEMMTLAESYIKVPELRRTIDNPMMSVDKKAQLLQIASGNDVTEITERLISLVLKEGREGVMQFIANSYITLYRQQKNITRGKLITAVPVAPEVEEKMKQMVMSRTNGAVEFVTEVNPDIIGGFVLEYDTYRMDTSVKSQLNKILKQLN